ncbi:MAG: flagellar protein export ATPase FliI [Candidatus Marinimicrobia bacterium]|nr:flagellar protein export ATPase FliI [Candidatus Neomarinimicrobiota bacterium]MCF7880500.1 flagellar protein export ATPase FliI [Candidatus Neomarinimicrobiota bacterium]
MHTHLLDIVDSTPIIQRRGRVRRIVGQVVEATGPRASVGQTCNILAQHSGKTITAEVVGFREDQVLLVPYADVNGISSDDIVTINSNSTEIPVGEQLLGRVLNGLGHPIDGKGPIIGSAMQPIHNDPPEPLDRTRITKPLLTGIRAIDMFLTCGRGQRVGIFAGSGVGKSVLLGMVARNTSADVNVIALIGERGREVRDFIEKDLGEEGLKRSVVIAVTSDQAPLIRIKGSLIATTIAEYFRDRGQNVMLMMDSVTRVAMAQREIGLSVGELPASKGYTPSVFGMLPKLLERAGAAGQGSITGMYTVLVEGDDMNDPVADTVRSILDGHIILSRKLASLGHYPAIDVLQSVSRVMIDVVNEDHRKLANRLVEVLATYEEAEDLINIGAYVKGSNPRIDRSIALIDDLKDLLQQDIDEMVDFDKSLQRMQEILGSATA